MCVCVCMHLCACVCISTWTITVVQACKYAFLLCSIKNKKEYNEFKT